MRHTVDYFLAPHSPWVYLGHPRFEALVRETGAEVRVRPMDLGQVFPATGGLPLPQRAPQRQAYRLVELRRFSEALGMPLNLQPAHFPVPGDPASLLITAVAARDGTDAALRLIGAIARAVWAEERDIADPVALRALLGECDLDAERLEESQDETTKAAYAANTRDAIAAGVFGAPSYVVDGELFWGQDRLDFVARRLRA
jgi:2-hydroxychromene-2-carboxylate isomerase